MARGRFISNTLGESDKFASLKNDTHRLMFVLMVTHADAEGRLKADTRWLTGKVYTLLDYSPQVVEEGLFELARVDLITLYEVNGRRYAEIVNFHEHNKIYRREDGRPSREAASKIPAPCNGSAVTTQRLRNNSGGGAAQVEVEVEVQEEVEDEVQGNSATPAQPLPNHSATEDVVDQQVEADHTSSEARMHRLMQGEGNDQYKAAAARTHLKRLLGRNWEHDQVKASWQSWYHTHHLDHIEATWKAAQTEAQTKGRPALFLFIDALNGNIPPLVKPPTDPTPAWDTERIFAAATDGDLEELDALLN